MKRTTEAPISKEPCGTPNHREGRYLSSILYSSSLSRSCFSTALLNSETITCTPLPHALALR
jgi:hypothetical protein